MTAVLCVENRFRIRSSSTSRVRTGTGEPRVGQRHTSPHLMARAGSVQVVLGENGPGLQADVRHGTPRLPAAVDRAQDDTDTCSQSPQRRRGIADRATRGEHVLDQGDLSALDVGALSQGAGAMRLGLLADEHGGYAGQRAEDRHDRYAAQLQAAEQLRPLGHQGNHLLSHRTKKDGVGLEAVLVEVLGGDLARAEGELSGQSGCRVDPQSRRPHSNPRATSSAVRDLIIDLRLQLARDGLDAGPVTIAWHLSEQGHRAPSTSTIRRILHAAALVVPEPRKRPRSSYHRFQASQPNECWQSDFTHWHLADGTDIEILNWLDDHSRYLIRCTAHPRVTGDIVVTEFLTACHEHGQPASTLTDNGRVYTARFGGGKNAYEYLLAILGITQRNGHPGHPQTQGKIERFHQTQKQWLAQQPATHTIAQLQHQLDRYRGIYNEQRPHRALERTTPAKAYTALPKATPARSDTAIGHHRLRYDHVDLWGKVSFRRAGRMHHLGVGYPHRGTRILAIADDTTVTVIHLETSEILSTHTIEPDKAYWRNTQRAPGRWPGAL